MLNVEKNGFQNHSLFCRCSRSSTRMLPGSITQWVADNVNHNIATLDGHGTFHGMGIISLSTPTTSTVTRRHEQLVRRENLVKWVK